MKRNLLLVLIGCQTLFGFAGLLTPDEALKRVKNIGTRSTSAYVLAESIVSPIGEPTLYVFNDTQEDSFMIVSADDGVEPLLGFSDSNIFNNETVPPAFRYWLNEYSRQIQFMRENNLNTPDTRSTIQLPDWNPVAPMIKTKWNQDKPYNQLCPVIDGETTLTGCVATAIAQVMKYFNYPAKAQGTIEYTSVPDDSTIEYTYSMDFSTVTFDWSDMLDNYNNNYTQTQADAVALLMKAAGFSVEMQYGVESSGAFTSKIPNALVTYFKYDKGIKYLQRTWFTYSKWCEILYNNLVNTGPIIYDGEGAGGAHSFVLDGYQSDGYFHFNWGWGGISDGYFLLDALNPSAIGIGGGAGGFNFGQGAILEIRIPEGGVTTKPQEDIYAYQGSMMGTMDGHYLNMTIDGDYPVVIYVGDAEALGSFVIKIEEVNNPDNSPEFLTSSNFVNLEFEPYYGFYVNDSQPMVFNLNEASLKANTQYKLTVGYKMMDRDWQPLFVGQGYSNFVYVTKNGIGSNATYNISNQEIKIFSAANVQLGSVFYYGYPVTVKGTLLNNTDRELTNTATLCFLTEDLEPVFIGENYVYSLSPDASVDFEYSTTLTPEVEDPFSFIGLNLYLGLFDLNTGIVYYLNTEEPVIMKEYQGESDLEYNGSVYVENAPEVEGVYIVEDAMSFDVTTEITVEKGYFFNDVLLWIFYKNPETNSWNSVTSFDYGYQEIPVGETKSMTLNVNYPEGEPGVVYGLKTMVKYDGDDYGWVPKNNELTLIKFTKNAGIGNVLQDFGGINFFYDNMSGILTVNGNDSGIESLDIYTVNGMKLYSVPSGADKRYLEIDVNPFAKGMLMIRAKDTKGKVKTYKLVR